MKRVLFISAALLGMATLSTPASAGYKHTHYCDCGHPSGAALCGSSSTSSTTTTGGTTTGGTTTTTGGTTTTSGGTTSTSGGTSVPEPGMLGMMGIGFVGLALARRRRR